MKTGCSFPLHDLHDIRPRLVSSFFMSCFPWDLTGFSGRIFFFGSTRSSLHRRQWHPTLTWKLPWKEEPGRLQCMGSLRVKKDWATSLSLSFIGEGNGNSLHCSCLENPSDGGAWWAAIYGDAQSWRRLKWLTSSSRSSLLLRTSLFSVSRGSSVIAVHWLFNPLFLLM